MPHDHTTSSEKKRRSYARLLLPMACAGMIIAGLLVIFTHSIKETTTVGEIRDRIHGIALREPDGGPIGPWWICASALDAETGDLTDFHLETAGIRIAAKRARVIVNTETDSMSLDLRGVVYVRIPDSGEQGPDHRVLEKNRMELGPIPISADVVEDRSPLASAGDVD